ncbi:MAG: HAD-IIIC family phosphatase [Candidatus Latescibacterota bacterium]|jgi:FkbH-like protein
MSPSPRLLLVSDFNLDNLAGLLGQDPEAPAVEPVVAPFGQAVQVLADGSLSCWDPVPAVCLVWTRPQAVLPAFARRLQGEAVGDEEILSEVDAYAELLLAAAGRVRLLLACTWALPGWERGYGPLDLRPGIGLGHALLLANLRLAERLAAEPRALVLDARSWLEAVGDRAWSAKLWHLGRIPFHREVFLAAIRDLKAALRGLEGQVRKLVVVDLDDTLWGGILGEVGWEGLRVGGHDPVGEAYLELQRTLKALTRRGVLLAIASRNEEALALEALARHPEMALRPEDFAGWRIDWQDKAGNLADLLAELNLGPQAAVFLDDSPVERDRVRQAFPEVLVPEWPGDPSAGPAILLGLRCFDVLRLSAEDRARAGSYTAERQRRELRRQVPSLEGWLGSLGVQVRPSPLAAGNAVRAAQLLSRTNQMTLTGRRATEAELLTWTEVPGREAWTYQVSDRFGDSGLTGLACLESRGDRAELVEFCLSCRVIGRGIEEAMLHHLTGRVQALGLTALRVCPVDTGRNQPCRELFARVFAATGESGVLEWRLPPVFPLPGHVRLEP